MGAKVPTAIDSYAASCTTVVTTTAAAGAAAAGPGPASGAAGAAAGAPLGPGALSRDLFAGALLLHTYPPPTAPADFAAAHAATCEIDGLCFTIKNLLVLREQLSPFAVSLTATTQTLDWRSTGAALQTLLSSSSWGGGAGSLLTLSTSTNPLLEFLAKGMPRVAEERVNFKSFLEDLLRRTCDTLITRVHGLCVGGVAELAGGEGKAAAARSSPAPSPAALLASVKPAVERAALNMEALLPSFRRRLGLYLGSPMTATILFSPIRDRVLFTFSSLRQHVYEALEGAGADAAGFKTTLDCAMNAALGVLEASDAVIVDPHNLSFGHDNAVFLAKVAEKRQATAEPEATI